MNSRANQNKNRRDRNSGNDRDSRNSRNSRNTRNRNRNGGNDNESVRCDSKENGREEEAEAMKHRRKYWQDVERIQECLKHNDFDSIDKISNVLISPVCEDEQEDMYLPSWIDVTIVLGYMIRNGELNLSSGTKSGYLVFMIVHHEIIQIKNYLLFINIMVVGIIFIIWMRCQGEKEIIYVDELMNQSLEDKVAMISETIQTYPNYKMCQQHVNQYVHVYHQCY